MYQRVIPQYIRKLVLAQIIPKNKLQELNSNLLFFCFFSSEKVALSKKKTQKETSGGTNTIGLYVPMGNPIIFEDFYWLKSFPKTNFWT